ncbi:MAG: hypothetical protein LJF30_25395 [Acidobacteria bacterium]|nr:hypothetical protein [Acidobacteriota bacterium]
MSEKRRLVRQVRRGWLPGLVAVVALGSCTSGSGGGSSGAGTEPATTGLVAAEKVKACAGFTAETAAGLLGVPAASITDHSSDLYEKLRSCSFEDKEHPGTYVTFSLRLDDSVEEAAHEMAVFRDHLGVARAVLPDAGDATKGAPVEEIAGLGDEAIWARVNGTLNVRWGNVTIQVSLPDDRDVQRRIAEKVLEGLR